MTYPKLFCICGCDQDHHEPRGSDLLDLTMIKRGLDHGCDLSNESALVLIAEVEAREAQTVAVESLHRPVEVEIEIWHEDEPCPAPEPILHLGDGRTGPVGCCGHIEKVLSCSECGHAYDDEQVVYRPWPCPTLRALARVEVLEANGEEN